MNRTGIRVAAAALLILACGCGSSARSRAHQLVTQAQIREQQRGARSAIEAAAIRDHYRQAAELDDNNLTARRGYARWSYATGDVAGAVRLGCELAEQRPTDWVALRDCGDYLLASGDPKGALIRFRELSLVQPRRAAGFNGMGNAYRLLRNSNEARRQYEEAVSRAPSPLAVRPQVDCHPDALIPRLNLANLLLDLREPVAAERQVVKGLRRPEAAPPEARLALLRAWAAQGRRDEVRERLRHFQGLREPTMTGCLTARSEIDSNLGLYRGATTPVDYEFQVATLLAESNGLEQALDLLDRLQRELSKPAVIGQRVSRSEVERSLQWARAQRELQLQAEAERRNREQQDQLRAEEAQREREQSQAFAAARAEEARADEEAELARRRQAEARVPAAPVDESRCIEASERSLEGCRQGARATTVDRSERAFLVKACEVSTQRLLATCRAGRLALPPSNASACESGKVYVRFQSDLPSLASESRVQELAKDGTPTAAAAKELLDEMRVLKEPRRLALLEAHRKTVREWFSVDGSGDAPASCRIAN